MSIENKLPPHNTDAEEALIGALLIANSGIKSLMVTTSDFYDETNRLIFEVCKKLEDRGVSINQISVAQELHTSGNLEKIGGVAQLSLLINRCTNTYDIPYHAEIIHNLSVYRQMIQLGNKIEQTGFAAEGEPQTNLNKIDDDILNLRKQAGGSPIMSPEEAAETAYERYSKLQYEEYGVAVSTGLSDLDHALGGGFYNGDMVIIAGRPGMGKTELSQTIANNASVRGPVLFCSAEMPISGLLDRVVAGNVGVSVGDIRRGKYSDELYDRIIGDPIQNIRESNIYYYHDLPMTTAKIMQAVTSMKLRTKLALVIIDYLGILEDEYGSNGYERVGYISRKVKQIALVHDVPVVALHQLNREVEHSADKRPQLKDLRDSGKLEEDSDVVLLLYRDSYYQEYVSAEQVNPITEILIAKYRQGPSNQGVKVFYDRIHHRYCNLAQTGQEVSRLYQD